MVKKRLERLNEVQAEAVNAALEHDHCTLEIATGIGKNFIAFKYLYQLVKDGSIKFSDEIWFLAETNIRLRTLEEESKKFKEIYGKDPLKDFKKFKFICYQAQPEGKPIVMICDEIHESLTPQYSKVYDNEVRFILGLSATIPEELKVNREDEDDEFTKGDLLESIAPIVYKYGLDQGIVEGLLAPFETTIIHHLLDASKDNIPDKIKGNAVVRSEQAYYNWRKRAMATPHYNKFYKANCGREMARLLWNLPSKVSSIKKLLSTLNEPTIIFANELDILTKITPNVVMGGDKKQEERNHKLITDFNSGKINVIASAKKLKQGITLKGIQNCILVSYYKSSWHMIQQLGRIIRFHPDKLAKLYIIKTYGTLEEKWFSEMVNVRDKNNKIVSKINLNVVKERFAKDI